MRHYQLQAYSVHRGYALLTSGIFRTPRKHISNSIDIQYSRDTGILYNEDMHYLLTPGVFFTLGIFRTPRRRITNSRDILYQGYSVHRGYALLTPGIFCTLRIFRTSRIRITNSSDILYSMDIPYSRGTGFLYSRDIPYSQVTGIPHSKDIQYSQGNSILQDHSSGIFTFCTPRMFRTLKMSALFKDILYEYSIFLTPTIFLNPRLFLTSKDLPCSKGSSLL